MHTYSGKRIIKNNSLDYSVLQDGWNGLYRTRPQEILLPKNTSEVCDAVRYIHTQKIPFRVRSGGHRVDGISSFAEGIVIDLRQLDSLHIQANNTITIGPAITMRTLYKILSTHGLIVPGGSCLDPSVVGVALGGGMGDLTRSFGWLAQNILSCELVTAHGERLLVNHQSHPELFWALRGAGGGNFGIVTSLSLQAYSVNDVFSGAFTWDWDTFIDFFDAFQRWFPSLDAKINVTASYKPQAETVGFTLVSLLDNISEIERACAPIFSVLPPPITHKLSRKSFYDHVFDSQTGSLVCHPDIRSTELHPHFCQIFSRDTMYELQTWLENFRGDNTTEGEVTMVTGAHYSALNTSKAQDDPVAIPHMNALFTLDVQAHWLKPEYDHYYLSRMRKLVPIITDENLNLSGVYLNAHDIHLDDRIELRYGENFAQLQKIKHKYDPENFFHFPSSLPIDTLDTARI